MGIKIVLIAIKDIQHLKERELLLEEGITLVLKMKVIEGKIADILMSLLAPLMK